MEENDQLKDINSKLTLYDDIEFDDEQPWPKPLVCIKSFPRSGTTYVRQNLVLNNFVVIKKKWDGEPNPNQPAPITILRNVKDCLVSNIAMSSLKNTDSDTITRLVVGQINSYDAFLDSLILDIDNRVPYTFSQLENNSKKVLESINSIYSLGLVENFVFANKIPAKKYIINYNTNKVEIFLPSSKLEKNYNNIVEAFEEAVDTSRLNETYLMIEDMILNKQKSLGIRI
jgi:hypothetical protein